MSVEVVGAVIGGLRLVVIMRHAEPDFGQQRGAEDPVVVDAGAVSFLRAGSHEGAARPVAAGDAEQRRLENHRPREAEAAAQAVLVGDVVVHLDVERILVLGEWQNGESSCWSGAGTLKLWLGGGTKAMIFAEIGLMRLAGI